MTDADEALVGRIRHRDAAALGDFLELRRGALAAYVERRLGQALRRKVEPEDIVQETCAEAVRALPEADLAQQDVFGWLCQIAEHRIVDAHRRFWAKKRSAAREVPLASPADGESQQRFVDFLVASLTTASEALSRNEREARLHAALDSLPRESSDAIRMRYVEGLPSKEIARRLGKTDGAVRVLLTRTLKGLAALLDPPTQ